MKNPSKLFQKKRINHSPPIHTSNVELNRLAELLITNEFDRKDFTLKNDQESEVPMVTIKAKTIDIHKKILGVLKINKCTYYTFTPRSEKPTSLIIKGINGKFTDEIILQEINDNIEDKTKVKKVSKFYYSRKNSNRYFHLVQVESNKPTKDITSIPALAYQEIKWDLLRRKKLFQCKNCQRLGHASVNCQLPFRCVKCAGNHGPQKCPLEKTASKDQLLCANCNQRGHPASYEGCLYITVINDYYNKKKNDKKSKIEKKTEAYNNYIQTGKSFANITSKNTQSQNHTHINSGHIQHRSNFINSFPQQQQHNQFNQEEDYQIPRWFQHERTSLNNSLQQQFNLYAQQFKILNEQMMSISRKLKELTDVICQA